MCKRSPQDHGGGINTQRGGKEMVVGCWAGKNKGTIIIRQLSLSEPAHVSTHNVLFPPNEHFTCFATKTNK